MRSSSLTSSTGQMSLHGLALLNCMDEFVASCAPLPVPTSPSVGLGGSTTLLGVRLSVLLMRSRLLKPVSESLMNVDPFGGYWRTPLERYVDTFRDLANQFCTSTPTNTPDGVQSHGLNGTGSVPAFGDGSPTPSLGHRCP